MANLRKAPSGKFRIVKVDFLGEIAGEVVDDYDDREETLALARDMRRKEPEESTLDYQVYDSDGQFLLNEYHTE